MTPSPYDFYCPCLAQQVIQDAKYFSFFSMITYYIIYNTLFFFFIVLSLKTTAQVYYVIIPFCKKLYPASLGHNLSLLLIVSCKVYRYISPSISEHLYATLIFSGCLAVHKQPSSQLHGLFIASSLNV